MLRAVAKQTTKSDLVATASQLMVTSPLMVIGFASFVFSNPLEGTLIGDWTWIPGCVAMVWPFAFLGLVWKLYSLASGAARVQKRLPRPELGTGIGTE